MLKMDTVLTPGEMRPHPGLPVLTPLFAFTLDDIPNLNDLLYMAPKIRSYAVKSHRNNGYKIGLQVARRLGLGVSAHKKKGGGKSMREFAIELADNPVTDRRIFCIASLWVERQTKGDISQPRKKRDVYNLLVKAYVDGLTDAALWEDDNTELHTDYWVSYVGLADRTRLELSFFAWGISQTLATHRRS